MGAAVAGSLLLAACTTGPGAAPGRRDTHGADTSGFTHSVPGASVADTSGPDTRRAETRRADTRGAETREAGELAADSTPTPRLNPFDDPFVAVLAGRPCPAPLGPAYTAAEMRQEAHYRAERGTSCWLAGTCREPNAYRYDRPNAEAVTARLRADPRLATSAIWIVAQARFISLLGCVESAEQAAIAEAVTAQVPDVQAVIPLLALPGEVPRYPLAAGR